ncbi:MAG: hypothetical protein ACKPKT_18640 [Dolichospermum sp.]
MTKIQIADLHSENFVELTAEEQYLIQGGVWWVVAAVLIRAVTPIVVRAIAVGGAVAVAHIVNKK